MCLLRLTCLSICLDLVKRCCLIYKDLVSFTVILQPIKSLLSKHLTAQTLPETLQVGAKGGLMQPDLFRLCFFQPLLLAAGASRRHPRDHRQRSCRSRSAGLREEETHPSEAAHAKDRGSVSNSCFFSGSSTVPTCCQHFKGSLLRLDYGKKRGCTREEKEKERLKHKYKKEFKGALRELRKDSSFLAREKLNEVIQR